MAKDNILLQYIMISYSSLLFMPTLTKLSFFFYNLFIASCFFSPTLRTIALGFGQLFWLVNSALKFFTGKTEPAFFDSKLKFFNFLVLAMVSAYLVLKLIHGPDLLSGLGSWLKTLYSTYGQWFWGTTLLASLWTLKTKKDTSFVQKTINHPLRTISFVVIITSSLLSIYIILQFFGIVPGFSNKLGILEQPFTNSGLILISFFITLAVIHELKYIMLNSISRSLILYTSLVQLAAIVLLGQISTWLGMMIALVFYVLFSRIFNLRQILIASFILIISLGLAYSFSPRIQRKVGRFASFETLLANRSMQCRFEIWKTNFDLWLEQPIFGINRVMPYQCQIETRDKNGLLTGYKLRKLTHAHNIYLQKLFAGGIFRFIVWMAFYVAAGLYLFRNIRAGTLPYFCCYLAISVEGLFENWWGDSEVLSLFFLMLILSLQVQYRKD